MSETKWRPGTPGPMPEAIADRISQANKGKHSFPKWKEWRDAIGDGQRKGRERRANLSQQENLLILIT